MVTALAACGDSADASGDVAELGRFGDQLPPHQPLESATPDLAVPTPAAPASAGTRRNWSGRSTTRPGGVGRRSA
jgi:hypothetical protein